MFVREKTMKRQRERGGVRIERERERDRQTDREGEGGWRERGVFTAMVSVIKWPLLTNIGVRLRFGEK